MSDSGDQKKDESPAMEENMMSILQRDAFFLYRNEQLRQKFQEVHTKLEDCWKIHGVNGPLECRSLAKEYINLIAPFTHRNPLPKAERKFDF